ncbi:hypothetical protein LCGC14_1726470 [marine sediment metagenome]|uniref:Uncharacterized protein n=1 Tax=marine sediment metagenome TaxID=412755 RepID=A0A0F9JRF9_9ZZZZ
MKYVHTFTVAAAVLTMAAQTAEARTLSFSSSSPPSAATSEVLKDWAETLKEATDGELEIEFYWQQSLSKLGDNLDAVASGLADMAVVVPAYSRQKLPLNYLSSTSIGTGDPWVISEAWLKTRKEFPAFIEEEVKAKAQIIAMGVYFYNHAELAEQVTSMLRKRGLGIKTLVGGMGITPKLAEELAVDAYAADGHQAQNKALALLGQ